ncbi:MAG: hypothetical protein JZU55_00190, partial [Afipia sp.]|nr:hypothetical protein [Afipia sp.]
LDRSVNRSAAVQGLRFECHARDAAEQGAQEHVIGRLREGGGQSHPEAWLNFVDEKVGAS